MVYQTGPSIFTKRTLLLGTSPQGAGCIFDSMDPPGNPPQPHDGHPGKAQHRRSSTTPGARVTAPSGAHLSDDGPLFNGAQDQGKLVI